jgi:hypothetical protein
MGLDPHRPAGQVDGHWAWAIYISIEKRIGESQLEESIEEQSHFIGA